MKFLRIASLACAISGCTASAWAQYGLYGSPEMLRLPQTTPVAASYNNGAAYPGVVTSANQPYPTTQAYPATPYYSPYPPQNAAVALYQPAGGTVPAPQPVNSGMPPEPMPNAQPLASPACVGNCDALGCEPACENLYGCNDGCFLWYASLSALVLGRSEGRRLWTSYADQHNTDQLTNTQDIHMPWSWGGEVQIGRRFCCGCETWALEGTFWTTESANGYCSTINSTISPYRVSTPLQVSDLEFDGTTATTWFDGAGEHRLWRHDEFYDAEINLVHMCTPCTYGSPWEIGWSAGVRYFRFDESLRFGSVIDGHTWTEDDGAYAAYLRDRVTNNLLGAQVGFDLAYRIQQSGVRVYVTPQFGIYNNNMNQHFYANLGDGTVGETPYGDFPVTATRNAIAFLSQIDVGLDWQFARNWSARVGYRVVAITGVALADDQFPQYIVDIPEIEHIDNHASLVLHGAYFGLTYNF